MNLLPVEEAQARLLMQTTPLPVEQVDLLLARDRYLAEPLLALRDQPWTNLSAMDGYAIRHADLPGPWQLTGQSRAGGAAATATLASGEAMRIFTGAAMPEGADAVLVQEDATVEGNHLLLSGDGPDHPGRNIRPRASDFAFSDPLLNAGIRIGATQIALAAMAGHSTLPVRRRPRVAIIGTGDELVAIGQPLRPGQIPSSNSIMLAAMLAQEGAEVIDIGLFPDDLNSITNAFHSAARADIIVSTGGASVGDHDLVAPAIVAAGGTLDFWKIAMRPGKPLMAGRLGDTCIIGLPGNPVSAFVGAALFLLPLVRRLAGSPFPMPQWTQVPTAIALPSGGNRAEYLRATIANGVVTEMGSRDSAGLRALAEANALIERPIDAPLTRPGETVRVMRLGMAP